MSYFISLVVLNSFWSILLISLVISVVTVLIYKWTTNQTQMKEWKDEQKGLQKKLKELKDKPEEMMASNKRLMEINSKYMLHSMKPTLFTLLPILLIFGWLQGHFAFDPIMQNQQFDVSLYFENNITGNVTTTVPEGIEIVGDSQKTIENAMATFSYKGVEGIYKGPAIEFSYNNKTYSKEVIISNAGDYETPLKTIKDKTLKTILTNNPKKIVMNLGFWKVSWLWSYIIFSLIFSMGLRKLLKVY